MDNESPKSSPKNYRSFRSYLHIGMGIVYLILGGIAISLRYFGRIELDPAKAYLLGGLLCLYGLFRLWRGFQDLRIQQPERTGR